MINRPYDGRGGDRVLIAATVQRVVSRPGDKHKVEVIADGACRFLILSENIHSVISEKIRVGDQVRVLARDLGPGAWGCEPWVHAEVLHIENAESVTCRKDAEPGEGVALLKPRSLSSRPQVKIKLLQRVMTVRPDEPENDRDPMPNEPTLDPPVLGEIEQHRRKVMGPRHVEGEQKVNTDGE